MKADFFLSLRRVTVLLICLSLWPAIGYASDEGLTLNVFIAKQVMVLREGVRVVRQYPVSTSRFGTGNRLKSSQTPLGKHRIARKIGEGAPLNAIFRNRGYIGKVSKINHSSRPSRDDRITSRILWLQGLEKGVNQGGHVDSFRRCIYIHGTADEGLIGRPASHGCIRMKNKDVVELFNQVAVGTSVTIYP